MTDDETVEIDLRARVERLDLETKVALLTGATVWLTRAVPEIGLRSMALSDGPAGVRGTRADDHLPSASFPSPTALAATWDVGAAAELGRAFAAEAHHQDVDVVLAPVVNLQRTPYGGRHFENYSEDPLLVGRIGAAMVRALQSHGIAATPKHFLGNETETERTSYVARIDERTLREVYLAPFVDVVEAGAWMVMSAYNGVDDGVEAAPMSEHRHLVVEVLKQELGFDGVVVSDWMAARRTVPAATGGLDLAMPGPYGPWGDALVEAVRGGEVAERVLDDKVLRLLRLARRVGALDDAPARTCPEVDVAVVLRDLAARATVVLHRTPGILPLGEVRRVALIGPNAVEAFTQGGGSAHVNPAHVVTPEQGLRDALGSEVELTVAQGCAARRLLPPADADRLGGWTLEHLDAAGRPVGTSTHPAQAQLHVTPLTADVARVVVTGRLRLEGDGPHQVGLHALGRHESSVGGTHLWTEQRTASGEDVLTSTNNNPPGASTTLEVDDARELELRLDIEIPDLDDFGRWSVVVVRHAPPGPSEEERLAAAVADAAEADVAVVVVGTTEEVESEGFDRTTLALPGRQDELVRAVNATGTPTIVVVNAGSPVLLPWLDEVAAVLWTWFPGQECGHALADVLLGRTEPAGRLPWTLPAREDDVPDVTVRPVEGRLDYGEGVFVGHRAWDAAGRGPARPFGFGLGWTVWETRGIAVDAVHPDGAVDLTVTVANAGERAGTAVAQVYLEPPQDGPVRPLRSLAGFATAYVEAGGVARVPVTVRARASQVWDVERHAWTRPAGTYRLHAGQHSRDLAVRVELVVDADGRVSLP